MQMVIVIVAVAVSFSLATLGFLSAFASLFADNIIAPIIAASSIKRKTFPLILTKVAQHHPTPQQPHPINKPHHPLQRPPAPNLKAEVGKNKP